MKWVVVSLRPLAAPHKAKQTFLHQNGKRELPNSIILHGLHGICKLRARTHHTKQNDFPVEVTPPNLRCMS